MKHVRRQQSGASLIEVLVSILILSFGMLSLGGMMAYAIQMPKLSAFRATAATQAGSYIERMRANKSGFALEQYQSTSAEPLTYNKQTPSVFSATPCSYPNCDAQKIAAFDTKETLLTLRRELPGYSGMRLICNVTCAGGEGDLWVMWDEPNQFGGINFSSSDECPDPSLYAPQSPRCLHVRFKL